jgi:tetratricopeptide (TPR) repeat protein
MLQAYGEGRSNEEVWRQALRLAPAELDERVDAWIRERFAKQLRAIGTPDEPGEYVRATAEARGLLETGKTAEAIRVLERMRDAFPELAEPGSPYHLLADLHERTGDRAAAAAELERAYRIHDSDYDGMLRAAALRLALGDTARAIVALERALYVHPYDPALHTQLAELYAAARRPADVVRERRAVVALKPVDMAEARYRLALALEQAGDRAEARREVLRALEVAPNYAAAQELLLRLSGGGR